MSGQIVTVDDRWVGNFGIGRYSQEVLPRLRVSWKPLGSGTNPASPLSVFDGYRVARNGSSVFYSPGYNVVLTKARQIITVMDLIKLDIGGRHQPVHRAYFHQVIRPRIVAAGKVITISDTSAGLLEKWLGPARVDVINAGIGCSVAFNRNGEAATFDGPYVVYVGNTKPHKNVEVMFRALSRVPDMRLVVVSNESAEFARLASAFGMGKRIELLTGLSDERLAEVYRGATATLLPSLIEGFGLPAAESINCGTPVLYWAGCASVREICGDDGIALQSSTDAAEWAAYISELNQRSFQVKGDLTRYSWETVGRAVDSVLEEYCA